jgi:hypothetical protein
VTTVIKQRGGCLSVFLVWKALALIVISVCCLISSEALRYVASSTSPIALILVLILACLEIVLLFGIWNWKLWGVFGMIGLGIFAFVCNLITGVGLIHSILGTSGAVILGILIFPRLDYYK